MDKFLFQFPVSGVETYLFLPPLVMFLISTFLSMGGVTGAFILLPFQMSVLGYTTPGVSGTNFVYNIVSIPLGVYRFFRDGTLCWTLFIVLMVGTLPGLFAGYYVRAVYLPDPLAFKPFVGMVLALLSLSMFHGIFKSSKTSEQKTAPPSGRITGGRIAFPRSQIILETGVVEFPTLLVGGLSLLVGLIGGAYGLGGGAILAPFCIGVLSLPPVVVAGAALFSTWVTSIVGAAFYTFLPLGDAKYFSPDWLLGGLFGLGGLAGVYLGARLQRKVPTTAIKIILALAITFIAIKYLWPVFERLLAGRFF